MAGRRKSVLEKQLEARLAKETDDGKTNTKGWIALHDRLKLERGDFSHEEFMLLQQRARDERPPSNIPSEERVAEFRAERAKTEAEAAEAKRTQELSDTMERMFAADRAEMEEKRAQREAKAKADAAAAAKREEQHQKELRERAEAARVRAEEQVRVKQYEDLLPMMRTVAQWGKSVSWSKEIKWISTVDLYLPHGLPADEFVAKDSSGQLATLSKFHTLQNNQKHPVGEGFLVIVKIRPSQIESLVEPSN